MNRDNDHFQNGYTRAKDLRESGILHSLREGSYNGMATEVLCNSLPRIPVELRGFKVRKHIKDLGKILWQEAVLAVHIQDDRLTKNERAALAAIARKLHGPRSVV